MSSEHRLHPFTIIFAFLTQIRLFVVPGLFVYFGASRRDGDWWQPWMMVLVVPNALVAMLRYFTYRYRYEESELVIRSGLVFRKERHIPYARIQNIDAVQNVLHRLLRVVEIRIETAGGSTAEATMSVLPVSALSAMRERVFAERHAHGVAVVGGQADASGDGTSVAAETVASVQATGAPSGRRLLKLDVRELMLCGFIENRGAVLIAAGFGVVWELGLFDRLMTPVFGQPMTGRGVMRNFARSLITNATVSWERIALTLAAFIGVLLLIRVFSMAWAVVRLYGFTATLVDDDARSEFGLLTRVAQTIPLRRIQAVSVREGPLHRFFKRVAVRLSTAGGRLDQQDANADREYIAPILRRAALDDFVRAMVGLGIAGTAWNAPHPRAFRREVKAWLATAAIIFLGLAISFRWSAAPFAPLLIGWAIVAARQTINHLGWAQTDEALLFKAGWLWRRTVVVRYAKIQTVTWHQTPFDRRYGMARVQVDTAGSSEGVVVIPYLAADAARALHARLAAEAAERQFQW